MTDPEKIARLKIVEKDQTAPRRWKNWKKAAALLLLMGASTIVYTLYRQGMFTPSVPVHIASVALVYPSQVITDFNASGYVVAQRRASVASKATGRLEYLGVKEGSRVKAGDVLARLENDDARAEQAQIEAQLAGARSDLVRAETELRTAERNYTRHQNLWDQKAVAQASYETAQDQHRRAKAAMESARANIRALEAASKRASILTGYSVIRAPFDGVILTKNADVGEVVAPFGSSINAKAAVVTMADFTSLMVEADVAESFLPKVHADQPCEIQLDALPDSRFLGKVRTIVPTADRTRGTVLVKVAFDELDPRILPEMSCRVAFLSRPVAEQETRPFLGIHREALTQRDGVQGIFRIENQRAEWTPVSKPEFLGDYVLLASPMQAGQQVVLKPASELKDRDMLKVAE